MCAHVTNSVPPPPLANPRSAAAVATLLSAFLLVQVWIGAALPRGRRAFVPFLDDGRDKLAWRHNGSLQFWLTILGQAIILGGMWCLAFSP